MTQRVPGNLFKVLVIGGWSLFVFCNLRFEYLAIGA